MKTQNNLLESAGDRMTNPRSDAIHKLLDDLESFEIPLNPYFDDPAPQGDIDDILTGMVGWVR